MVLGSSNGGGVVKYSAVGEDGETDQCKFKSDYFTEFDINPLTKLNGEIYSFSDINRNFEFNICEPLETD